MSSRPEPPAATLARVEALAKKWLAWPYKDWGGDVTREMGRELQEVLDGGKPEVLDGGKP